MNSKRPNPYHFFIGFALLTNLIVSAQSLPKVAPPTPQPTNFRVITPNSPSSTYRSPKVVIPNVNQNTRNQQQPSMYKRDRQEVLRREAELKRIKADLERKKSVQYPFPNLKNDASRQHYRKAFEQLKQLNPDEFSVKQANFIVENAYYDNTNDFSEYDKAIKNSTAFIKQAMNENGSDPNNNLAKNLTILGLLVQPPINRTLTF